MDAIEDVFLFDLVDEEQREASSHDFAIVVFSRNQVTAVVVRNRQI